MNNVNVSEITNFYQLMAANPLMVVLCVFFIMVGITRSAYHIFNKKD